MTSDQPLASQCEITPGERMVPAHAREFAALGWSASTQDLPNGVKLVVTGGDPQQMGKVKALGFMGVMMQDTHHQPHHPMTAKGEFPR